MTDGRFEKLVNLYLDKEISPSELSDLKAEIAHNLVRKQRFERMCRVHAASRKALISHSASSGVKKFLREEVATVETRHGQRARVRQAGRDDEAVANAQQVLWRTGLGFICILVAAGLLAAYAIDRTASIVRKGPDSVKQDEPLDTGSLQSRLFAFGKADAFIVATLDERRSDRISQFLILRLDHSEWAHEIPRATPDMLTMQPWQGDFSPMEIYQIERALKEFAGQMPGTSTPITLPDPGNLMILGTSDASLIMAQP